MFFLCLRFCIAQPRLRFAPLLFWVSVLELTLTPPTGAPICPYQPVPAPRCAGVAAASPKAQSEGGIVCANSTATAFFTKNPFGVEGTVQAAVLARGGGHVTLLMYISPPDSRGAIGAFCICFYNRACRLRLEKLLYIGLSRSPNGVF
jgi:hypothetical protein